MLPAATQRIIRQSKTTGSVVGEQTKQHKTLRQAFAVLPSAMIILDDNGTVVDCNPVAYKLLGMSLLGKQWIQVIEGAFSPQIDDGHEVSLRDGSRVNIVTQSLAPESGQVILISDLTKTRQLQESLNQQKQLQKLGEMTAQLAHQIRTPLTTAMLYATHLTNNDLSADKRSIFAEKTVSNLKYLEQQVKDMLLFAKGEKIICEACCISSLLEDVKQSLLPYLTQQDANLDIINESLIREIKINRESLLGALQNLIHNAVQATDGEINITLKAIQNKKNYLDLVVIDNGRGMSLSLQKKVFQAFFTTRTAGTGLGLAVVQAVALSHQGSVLLESKLGQGTQVGIRIPIRR